MAAVIVTSTPRRSAPRRSSGGPALDRPPLEVLEGGRRAARAHRRSVRHARYARPLPAGVYRRRRLGAVLGLVTVVLVAYLCVSALLAPSGSAAGSSPATGMGAHGSVYVVQPGDTLWSIARSLHPHGDVRALVDQLEVRAGGANLQPGQQVRLDGLHR